VTWAAGRDTVYKLCSARAPRGLLPLPELGSIHGSLVPATRKRGILSCKKISIIVTVPIHQIWASSSGFRSVCLLCIGKPQVIFIELMDGSMESQTLCSNCRVWPPAQISAVSRLVAGPSLPWILGYLALGLGGCQLSWGVF